jgi:hypothetical protein
MKRIVMGSVLVAMLSLLACGCGASPQPHAVAALTAATVSGRALPVSVQSGAAMRAAGDDGPSSSIMVPSSCTVTAKAATASGTYQGSFVPAVYQRYGDVIDLYVYTRPLQGYPNGIQLADQPFTRQAPFMDAGGGRWTVTVPVATQLGQPARCVVAAQPTMEFQGAPSA